MFDRRRLDRRHARRSEILEPVVRRPQGEHSAERVGERVVVPRAVIDRREAPVGEEVDPHDGTERGDIGVFPRDENEPTVARLVQAFQRARCRTAVGRVSPAPTTSRVATDRTTCAIMLIAALTCGFSQETASPVVRRWISAISTAIVPSRPLPGSSLPVDGIGSLN